MDRAHYKADLLRLIVDMGYRTFKELSHEIEDDLKRITNEMTVHNDTKEIIVSLKKECEIITSDGTITSQPLQQQGQKQGRKKKPHAQA